MRCCSYGNAEHRKATAEKLAAMEAEVARLRTALEMAQDSLDSCAGYTTR